VWFINFSVVKFRAENLVRTNLFSHYDAEGRHPVYWYTQLDGVGELDCARTRRRVYRRENARWRMTHKDRYVSGSGQARPLHLHDNRRIVDLVRRVSR
jgi:hypothetical protein